MKSRRNILITVGTATSVVLAGCLGDDDDEWPDPPDEETPTEELLPDNNQWPLDRTNEQAAGAIGANDGIQGWWDGPDGESYSMEIMRFSDESSSEETAEQYIEEFDWFLSLSHGVFSFAVNGPDGVHARELLAASPALNEAMVADKTPEADGFPSDGSEQDGTSDEETGESEEDESDESDHEGEPEYTVEGNFPEEAEINEEFTFSMIISNEGDGVGSGPATIGATVSTDDTIDTQVFFEDEIELQPGETEEIESEPFSWDEPISLQWQVYVESPETGETVDAEYYETEIYR